MLNVASLPCSGVHIPSLASPHLLALSPASGVWEATRSSHCCPGFAYFAVMCIWTAVPVAASREPETFRVLRQSSRNVKLRATAICLVRSNGNQLAEMVRFEQWEENMRPLLSASIVSWARTTNGQMALAANIFRRAASPSEPSVSPSGDSTALQPGRSLR